VRSNFSNFVFAVTLTFGLAGVAPAQDPPSRVARLNYVSGNVSIQPAGIEDWTPAEINRPFTNGDTVFTDFGSRAEFHLDTAVVRAGEQTSFGFLTLNDKAVQLRLTGGDLYVNVRELDPTQFFEVDSPNAAITILRPGVYRFRIASNGELTFVVVRQGQAEITGGGQAVNVPPGNSASITGTTQFTADVEPAPQPDDFDMWSQDRDTREAQLASARYLPRNVVGYEDLDAYGGWQTVPSYGPVWYPRTVVAGWAPYHYGHWAWIEPWGWTWVDDAPWGFAPFHYGRWAFIAGRWGWCPGPIVIVANRPAPVRPVYAPALVAWFGGPHFGVAIGIGGGAPSLGWVALGIGEVYAPSYHCSPNYFNNVNVSNTTVVKTTNITNVYNTVYVNKTVYNQTFVNAQAPNAVSAMPQNSFASGRPVSQAGVAVAPAQVSAMQAAPQGVVAPQVAPTRQALLASNTSATVVRPPAALMAQKVVVKNAPAVSPAPFAARQAYLQQHVGEPHDFATMHQQVAAQNPSPQMARVANVPPVKPVPNAPRPMMANPVQPVPATAQHANPQPPNPQAPNQPRPNVVATSTTQQPHNAYPEREHPSKPPAASKPPSPPKEHKDKGEEKKDKH
jgi:hypothetical protein